MTGAARWLIVNADDFGLSPGVNEGIVEAHLGGIVTSTTLMVHAPAARQAAALARTVPAMSLGLHVDLGEWIYHDGAWCARYQRVDPGDESAVEAEVSGQITRFEELTGRWPSHLDSHQHVHRDEPVARVLAAAGERLAVPVRGGGRGIAYVGGFYGQLATGEPYHDGITVEALVGIIAALGEGVSELGCHVGHGDQLDSVYAEEREIELATICDPRVRQALADERVRLCSFVEVSPDHLAGRPTTSQRPGAHRSKGPIPSRPSRPTLRRAVVDQTLEAQQKVLDDLRQQASRQQSMLECLLKTVESSVARLEWIDGAVSEIGARMSELECATATGHTRVDQAWTVLERRSARIERAVLGIERELGESSPVARPHRVPTSGGRADDELDYAAMVAKVRAVVEERLPPGSVVAVVSKGDADLISFSSREGWHFPQMPDGVYAGHYPADGSSAVAQLEALRQKGARYLLFPATAQWWFGSYPELRTHLEDTAGVFCHDESCTIFALPTTAPSTHLEHAREGRADAWLSSQVESLVRAIVPPGSRVGVASDGDVPALDLAEMESTRFPGQMTTSGAGWCPNGEDLIQALNELRGQGVQYLVVPRPSFWWLGRYPGLRAHLEAVGRCVLDQQLCKVFTLERALESMEGSEADG